MPQAQTEKYTRLAVTAMEEITVRDRLQYNTTQVQDETIEKNTSNYIREETSLVV
jgi:hypothetical protein